MVMGIDPYTIVGQGGLDFFIKSAMLQKAMELREIEQKNLATRIGQVVIEAISRSFK